MSLLLISGLVMSFLVLLFVFLLGFLLLLLKKKDEHDLFDSVFF
jgi:hypothetical protein